MKYNELNIQTQREFPNNARTQGFGWLVRAGFMTRENQLLPLGKKMVEHLQSLSKNSALIPSLSLPFLANEKEVYFPLSTGNVEIAHCKSCGHVERLELASFKKSPLPTEKELPLEKVSTPDCNTIELLANLLNIPKEKTAKALMYTRISDNRFVFIVVRGDMQLSEAKLKKLVGEIRLATSDEISKSGAAAGYASPIGLKDALIVVDDLIPESQNLVAGANEAGFHLKNTNYPRDYSAEFVADVVQAKEGDLCEKCGHSLSVEAAILLSDDKFYFDQLLLALAETHHDEKGLTFPPSVSAFDVYLMHVPGKTIDTRAKAEEVYAALQNAGISVLFDDRDERAGVKFNDADLIGCPLRVTVGEKALQNGMVELKPRKAKENALVAVDDLTLQIKQFLA